MVSSSGQPLRVAVCLSYFHPTVGGAESQMLQLATHWVNDGHRSLVFTRRAAGLANFEEHNGLEIHRAIKTLNFGPLFGVTFINSLTRQLVRNADQYDVVLAAQAPWEAVAAGRAVRRTNKPSLVRIANTGPFGDLRQLARAKGRKLLTQWFHNNTAFLALSQQAEDELQDFGCPPESIHRVTNGVDLKRFAPPTSPGDERTRTVLFAGRLAAQKNPQLLLQAWQRVNTDGEYRLLIAGDGPLRDQLKETCREMTLEGVEFLGQCSDMVATYRRAGVFVLPSRSEGCSNALLEAMACELCPIVTNIGGNSDVISHGENGRLFDPERADELTEQLSDLLKDVATQQRLAVAARKYVTQHHDLDQVAARYLNLFATLLE